MPGLMSATVTLPKMCHDYIMCHAFVGAYCYATVVHSFLDNKPNIPHSSCLISETIKTACSGSCGKVIFRHTHTRTHPHAHRRTHTRARIHMHVRRRTHTRTHTRAHPHPHTHNQSNLCLILNLACRKQCFSIDLL